jgi:hypothetical protein
MDRAPPWPETLFSRPGHVAGDPREFHALDLPAPLLITTGAIIEFLWVIVQTDHDGDDLPECEGVVLDFNTQVTALDGRAVARVSRLKNSLDPIVAMGLGQPTFGTGPRSPTSLAHFLRLFLLLNAHQYCQRPERGKGRSSRRFHDLIRGPISSRFGSSLISRTLPFRPDDEPGSFKPLACELRETADIRHRGGAWMLLATP